MSIGPRRFPAAVRGVMAKRACRSHAPGGIRAAFRISRDASATFRPRRADADSLPLFARPRAPRAPGGMSTPFRINRDAGATFRPRRANADGFPLFSRPRAPRAPGGMSAPFRINRDAGATFRPRRANADSLPLFSRPRARQCAPCAPCARHMTAKPASCSLLFLAWHAGRRVLPRTRGPCLSTHAGARKAACRAEHHSRFDPP